MSDMKETQLRVAVGQYSDKGRKQRNDDSYGVVTPTGTLLTCKGIAMAIADGMSSSEAAKEASESCVKSFLTDYYATHDSWTVKTSVARVLSATNRWLYGQGQTQYLSDRGMVSTFSGMVVKGTVGYVFHAGDSRITLIRGGEVEPLTNDHRMRLSRHEDVLSRAFGIDPELDVDYRSLRLYPGDLLVFTTDGVHDHLTAHELCELACDEGLALDGRAGAMAAAALANGSGDNLTVQLVLIEATGAADTVDGPVLHSALPFPPDLETGMTLDGYEVLRLLHASKKTQIYLAKCRVTGERVTLKTPSVSFADDPDYIEHFTREEWIGRSLNSPHVVKVIEPEKARQFLYYTTEYIGGVTLQEWMDTHPAPPLNEVRDIITQVAKGLRAFHRKEMLHQDLKPDNIMIDGDGVVKLVDFGSTYVAGLEELSMGGALAMRGTVDYTAPEYHLGAKPGRAADIYSLGTLAYQMITGRLPYGKGFATPAQARRLSHIPAHHVREDVPYWVSAALARAVHKDPAFRYKTLSAFEQDLKKPNPKFANAQSVPLMQRNPKRFWQAVALVMTALNLLLLLKLSGHI